MKRIKLVVSYDGTNYCGWQMQPRGVSVEAVLNEKLSGLLREEIAVIGASRTDSGVHANRFCISLKTEFKIPCERLRAALNHFLPEDIAVLDCREVPEEFHARYSCTGKEYIYRI